jgi:hypothetical protein
MKTGSDGYLILNSLWTHMVSPSFTGGENWNIGENQLEGLLYAVHSDEKGNESNR